MSDSEDDLESLRLAALRSKKASRHNPAAVPSHPYLPHIAPAQHPVAHAQQPLGPPPAFVYTQPPPPVVALAAGLLPWSAPAQMAPLQRPAYAPPRRAVPGDRHRGWRRGRGPRSTPHHRPPPSRPPQPLPEEQPPVGSALTYIVPARDGDSARGGRRHGSGDRPATRKESAKFSRFERHSDSDEDEEEDDVTFRDVIQASDRQLSVEGTELRQDVEGAEPPADTTQQSAVPEHTVEEVSEEPATETADTGPAGAGDAANNVSTDDSPKAAEEAEPGGSSPDQSTDEDGEDDADVINMGLDEDDDFDKMLAEFEDFVENPTDAKKSAKAADGSSVTKKKKKRERKNSGRAAASRQNSENSHTNRQKSKQPSKSSDKQKARDSSQKNRKPSGEAKDPEKRATTTAAAAPSEPTSGGAEGVRSHRAAPAPDGNRRVSPVDIPRDRAAATAAGRSAGDVIGRGDVSRAQERRSPAYLSPRRPPPPRPAGVYVSPRRSPSPPPLRPLPLTQEEFIRRMQLGLPLRDGGSPAPRRTRSRSPWRRSPSPLPPGRRIRTPSLSPSPPRRLSPRRQGGALLQTGRFSRSPPPSRRRSSSPSNRRRIGLRRSDSPANRRPLGMRRSNSPASRRPIGARRSDSPANRRPIGVRRSDSPPNRRPMAARRSASPAGRRPLVARRGRGMAWQSRQRVGQRLGSRDPPREGARDARDRIRNNRDSRDAKETVRDDGAARDAREQLRGAANPLDKVKDKAGGRDSRSPQEETSGRRPRGIFPSPEQRAEEAPPAKRSPSQEKQRRAASPDADPRAAKRRRGEKQTDAARTEKQTAELKKQGQLQDRLQRLPSVERERVLRRMHKFQSSSPVVGRTQTIRLRATADAADSSARSRSRSPVPTSLARSPAPQQEEAPGRRPRSPEPPARRPRSPEPSAAAPAEGERRRRRQKPTRRGDGRRVVVVAEEETPPQQAEDSTAARTASSVFSRLGGNSGASAKPSPVTAPPVDSGVSRRKLKLKRAPRDGSSSGGGETESRASDRPDPLEGRIRAVRARNAALLKRSREVAHDKKLYG